MFDQIEFLETGISRVVVIFNGWIINLRYKNGEIFFRI